MERLTLLKKFKVAVQIACGRSRGWRRTWPKTCFSSGQSLRVVRAAAGRAEFDSRTGRDFECAGIEDPDRDGGSCYLQNRRTEDADDEGGVPVDFRFVQRVDDGGRGPGRRPR
jgi:hypothetical protein